MFASEFSIDLSQKTQNVLDYLFQGDDENQLPTIPQWIDAENASENMSQRDCFLFVKRMGYWLTRSIAGPGDIVLVVSPNHVLFPISYLGIIASGAAFSGSNPLMTPDELAYQLKDTEAKAVLVHPLCVPNVLAAAQKVGLPSNKIFLFHSGDESLEVSGLKDWRRMAPPESESRRWRWRAMDAQTARKTLATVNYSSGTTGLPKGVRISHANLIANVEQSMYMRDLHPAYFGMKNPPKERWIGFLPLFHAFGQMYTILCAVKTQTPVYVMKKFEFLAFLRAMSKYKITHLHTAPPVLVLLNARPEVKDYDLSALKEILCGAAPLSSSLQNGLHQKFGVNIKQGWGMTEVVCGGMHVPGGDYHDDSGSVGKLDPNCQAILRDDDGNEITTRNTPGELFVRGPNICMGYHRNQKATEELIDKDGWLRTGDVAVVDDRNWWRIVDRRKELIKVKGLQVAPAELEAILLENDDIADAAVVAFQNEKNQEVPRAYVQMKPNAAKDARMIEEWVAKRVSPYKRLTGGVAFVDEIPKLPSGKIVRKVMREWSKRDSQAIRARL